MTSYEYCDGHCGPGKMKCRGRDDMIFTCRCGQQGNVNAVGQASDCPMPALRTTPTKPTTPTKTDSTLVPMCGRDDCTKSSDGVSTVTDKWQPCVKCGRETRYLGDPTPVPAGDPELDRVLERLAYIGQGIARDFDTTLVVALPAAARLLAAVTSAGD